MDFNNPVSNDRAVSHGGDAVSSDDSAKSEKIFIDTRRFANRVQAVALTASQFTGTFGDVKLETLDVTIKHLVFVESSQPADSVKIPWNERTLISVNPLFNNGLKRELPKPRTPALDEPTALKDAEKETPTVLIDKGSNFVVLFKLSRASFEASATGAAPKKGKAADEGEGGLLPIWNIEGVLGQSLSRTRDEVAHAVQQSMSDLFPWLRVGDVRLFGSVPMICAALSSTALPLLKPQFMKARDGLDVRAFVDILFKQLLGVEPRLRDAREASSVVSLLHELFRQIDINGDQLVDWEEFTNHTISSGMMAGSSDPLYGADEFTVSYELDLGYSPTSSGGPSAHGSVQLMRYVPELGRILVVSKDSPKFKAYDALGGFQHEYSFDAGGEAGGPASPSARGGGADAEAPSEGVIHDLIYISERQTLVAALSDHAIHLLTEQLSSAGKHRTYKSAGVIVTHSLHRMLVWSPTADRLFSVDTYSKLYNWSLDSAVRSQKLAPARDARATCPTSKAPRFPLVLPHVWTSHHLSERSRRVDGVSGTRARGARSDVASPASRPGSRRRRSRRTATSSWTRSSSRRRASWRRAASTRRSSSGASRI